LMSFLEGSPARTSAAPERAQGLTDHAADCGQKWHGSFAKYHRDSCSWKTVQCSLLEDSELFSETWPRWGSMRNGVCSELTPQAPIMSVTASGSRLPTLTLVSCEHPGRRKIKPHQQTCISAELALRDNWLIGGQYSPNHAAWFMGWPDLWTSLGHSVMDKFLRWQQQHGGFLPQTTMIADNDNRVAPANDNSPPS
jgi:hypothetical protein